MTIQYNGANSVTITTKSSSIVIDPYGKSFGNFPKIKQDIVILTDSESTDVTSATDDQFIINGPGEYEILNNSVSGIPAQRHVDSDGKNTTIYTIRAENIVIGVFGHIDPKLTEEQFEEIGVIDVAIIPVGGNGYTLDSEAAAAIIKEIEPKIVIPVHYNSSSITYPVPQAEVDLFLNELGVSDVQTEEKLKLKDSQLPDTMTVIKLAE